MKESFFDAKESVLDNGIRLVTVKKDTQLMTIYAAIEVGSLNEEKHEKGISHFIEHMLFKGTETRNNESLNEDIENLGGECNAYTDYISTVYSMVALGEELPESLEILSDMIINSNFPEEELEKERGVILSELKTSKDDIEDLSFRKINKLAFDKSPIRYEVLGDEKNLKSFRREDLLKYYNKYYVPNNCIISVASSYEHDEVKEVVEKYFLDWQKKELYKKPIIVEDNKCATHISYKKDIEQNTIMYLYTFHGLSKYEELVLRILNHKLGDSANSILFRELREKRGLAYDVYSNIDCSNNVKTLYIYTAVDEENVEEAIEVINKAIDDIKKEKIIFNENTLDLMKKVFKTALASTLEDVSDLCHYVLCQRLDDEHIYEFYSDMKSIENMESGHIYSIANKVLNNPTVHILKSEKSE
ncbi:Predicted Zn-dependent peptidase [Clostridium collagenovorans DSM 3089]|uniref:Predicted Zn-dependent peptidase n=1 Tax=Clostridium collagenovorans DSM 3089 TaxID=1121306 RepID=A0A1M5VTW5_9CLOT|nr:pitrilysin family protein [Clostridium collagenovorans]SHH78671.1 Predicted Zn-dependent peptidase [Clostridium collagenovorans DSM 3089]